MNTLSHLIARKTADETVTSSTTLQDDDHLTMAVAANEAWSLNWRLLYNANATGDLKIAWTQPASGLVNVSFYWQNNTGSPAIITDSSSASPTTSLLIYGGGAPLVLDIPMIFVNGANAGNLTLQWAQSTSDVGGTIMKANSTLTGIKLA